jgi:hypothetical protein
MLGTAHLTVGMWTMGIVGGIAAGGVACLVGSALVKNMGCHRPANQSGWSPHAANARKVTVETPAVEAAPDVATGEDRARRRVMDGRQRERRTGRGV